MSTLEADHELEGEMQQMFEQTCRTLVGLHDKGVTTFDIGYKKKDGAEGRLMVTLSPTSGTLAPKNDDEITVRVK